MAEQHWPMDPHGYIFLLRAIEQMGRGQHGENWSAKARLPLLNVIDPDKSADSDAANKRIQAETLKTLLSRPDLAGSISGFSRIYEGYLRTIEQIRVKRKIAQASLARRAAAASRWSRDSMPKGGNAGRYQDIVSPSIDDVCRETISEVTAEQWRQAARDVLEESKAIWSAQEKLRPIAIRIIKACEAGNLRSSVRLPDGRMVDMPNYHWNGENLWSRFLEGRYNPTDPFDLAKDAGPKMFIFFPLESFTTWSMNAASPKPTEITPAIDDVIDFHTLVPKRGRKQQIVYRALVEVWKDGRIPKALTIAEIENRINPIVRRLGDAGGAGSDNIRRALGLK